MEIEKAIEVLKAHEKNEFTGADAFVEAYDIAIQALEKQVPKSITDKDRKLPEDTAYCPTCGAFLSKHHKFCFNCGQALKVGDKQ